MTEHFFLKVLKGLGRRECYSRGRLVHLFPKYTPQEVPEDTSLTSSGISWWLFSRGRVWWLELQVSSLRDFDDGDDDDHDDDRILWWHYSPETRHV